MYRGHGHMKMNIPFRVVLFYFSITKVSGLVCLSCTNIAQPRHCHVVKECDADQFCATEKFADSFGDAYFNIGCLDKQKCHANKITGLTDSSNIHCSGCCQGDLCNVDLCGAAGYPNQTAPICYSCKSLPSNRKCHQIDVCGKGEVCFVQGTEEFGDVLINSGCKTPLICDALLGSNTGPDVIVGKRSSHARSSTHNKCSRCCNQKLCNEFCDEPRDCLDIKLNRQVYTSGLYTIALKSRRRIKVWCDMTSNGGGWTVFQKRYDGSVDFYQNFTSYQYGFGNSTGEFWLGLECTHELTAGHSNTLRVDYTDSNGTDFFEELPSFNVGPGTDYVLHVSNRSTSVGTAHSHLDYYNGQKFSTYDMDQDFSGTLNCAALSYYHGGFWYRDCSDNVNPNAVYNPGGSNFEMIYVGRYGSRAMQMKFRRNI